MTFDPTSARYDDQFDDMQGSVDALMAFTTMLETIAFHDAGSLKVAVNGLTDLVMPHLHRLSCHVEYLRRSADEDRAAEATGDDMAETEQDRLEGFKRTISGIIAEAVEKGSLTPSDPTAADLRNEFIAEKLAEGIEPSTIAQAMNLRKSAVEKVAAQLRAGDVEYHPETTAQAVNS